MTSNELSSQWEQRLAEYESSGKTIASWCQEHSIRYSRFHYWRRKLRVDQAEEGQPVKWLSLELENAKQVSLAPDSIAVHIGQVTIELKKGFDPLLFREIVQVLQTI